MLVVCGIQKRDWFINDDVSVIQNGGGGEVLYYSPLRNVNGGDVGGNVKY